MNILTVFFIFLGSYGAAEDECIKVYAFDDNTGDAEYVTGCTGERNAVTGALKDTGKCIEMPAPVCVSFFR